VFDDLLDNLRIFLDGDATATVDGRRLGTDANLETRDIARINDIHGSLVSFLVS
jgi:hypothetical protein